MDIILIILGVLGMGAIVIAAYVFTVSARNYVSDDLHVPHNGLAPARRNGFVVRSSRDRRRGIPVDFPMTVNSVVISRDRRRKTDRRSTA